MPRERKLPDGMKTREGRDGYYADFQVNGRRVRDFLSTDFKAACQILNDLKARADKADFNLLDNQFPIDDVRHQYLAHCKQVLDPSTVRCYTDWLRRILPALGVAKVSQLSPATVLAYREQRLANGKSPRTVNAEVGALSTMLNWAVDPARLIGSNPVAGVKPLPHLRPKEGRPLADDEVPKLLEASPPQWRDIWYAFLVTGLRKSELAGLQFTPEFLDWESREIIVPDWLAKNGLARRIPIDDRLYEILRRQEAGRKDRQPGKGRGGPVLTERIRARFTRDHIFVTTQDTPLDHKGNLWRALVSCLKRAGIPRQTIGPDGRVLDHVDLHSLRRTFATSLIVGGADPKTVQELLGHKTLAMTMKVYAKVRPATKRQAMSRLAYGSGASAPAHVLPLPQPAGQCHQSVTTAEREAERKAE
jgi:integrase